MIIAGYQQHAMRIAAVQFREYGPGLLLRGTSLIGKWNEPLALRPSPHCVGDGRRALNMLELGASLAEVTPGGHRMLTIGIAKEVAS